MDWFPSTKANRKSDTFTAIVIISLAVKPPVAFPVPDYYLHRNRRHLYHRPDHRDRGRCKHLIYVSGLFTNSTNKGVHPTTAASIGIATVVFDTVHAAIDGTKANLWLWSVYANNGMLIGFQLNLRTRRLL
uniref:Uncharacterized protein n=1 Tax=Glossina pallidipes TaxID=7398 RepID=A0A1B0ABH9_GLOPL